MSQYFDQIIIQNLTYKTSANQLIFDKLNLTLSNNKTALIGKNGIGKTTLLKLITKNLYPDKGSITTISNIGYCPQDFPKYSNITIAKFFSIDKKLKALENIRQGNCNPQDFAAIDEDWNTEERIQKILEKFSLKIKNLFVNINTLSNGEITKLHLIKIFYEPSIDYLILDEPTNNLDIHARKMLYQIVTTWQKGMLIISHDRKLLELMDQIVAITEHGIRIYGGNYSFYEEQQKTEHLAKKRHFLDTQKTLTNIQNSIQNSKEKHEQSQAKGKKLRRKNDQPKGMLDFAKNRSGRTQNTLNKQAIRLLTQAKTDLDNAKNDLDNEYIINVTLPKSCIPSNKIVACLENISFRYNNNETYVLDKFNLIIKGPKRIAICGANGSGKTTLLKLLQKTLAPNKGAISINVNTCYLDQKLEILKPQLSVLDNYLNLNPKASINHAYSNLANFLFRNGTALKKVEALSSGEKMRAALACVLSAEKPPELLLLDEPTNHLDLENLKCLESILRDFSGALIIVTHDTKFLENLNIDKIIFL